jgi:hypothetical protein
MDLTTGQRVRITTDPGRIGVVTGRSRPVKDRLHLQVQFPEGAQYVSQDHLEPLGEQGDDPIDLFKMGRLGRAVDLRKGLIHSRLTGRLANMIYSMDMTGADFYAYQFKPLVKLLSGATNGILIADEVGLGKTIEGGLIWTELRSRFDFQRLLVVCPAVLREKWRRELRQRFGIDALVVNATDLLEHLRRAQNEPNSTSFALVVSLPGIRPPKIWDEEEISDSSSPRHRRTNKDSRGRQNVTE